MSESQLPAVESETPLARYTSWRVGGPAGRLVRPESLEALCALLRSLDAREPLTWLGLGSNVLIRDGGIRGTVILLNGVLNGIEIGDDGMVYVEAGASCPKVARQTVRAGLQGLEFWGGIPGSCGGALAMNAGCFGSETWRWVEQVQTIDRHGNLQRRAISDYEVGYRSVTGPVGEWFVGAWFRLDSNGGGTGTKIQTLLEQRSASQPTGEASGGSVFRNPPDDFAGRLIESAGLKGLKLGGARVSEKHANFIVNDGTATAMDIESLIERVQERVRQAYGIDLKPEVHILGEKAAARSN